jgi:hypothetical protein
MNTFKHSGDLGDIIYSLPTVRALGGGILYLDPTGGESDELIKRQCPDGKTKLNESSINSLIPLLKLQNYIVDVKIWRGELITHDLNGFREVYSSPNRRSKNGNLCDLHLQKFNLPFSETEKAWLETPQPTVLDRKVVIARSPRVQGAFGVLNAWKHELKNKAVFVGVPKEHEFFEWTFGISIPYHKTETIMELASVIKGSEQFIGNSSFPLSLAIGMGHHNIIQEVDPKVPVTVFENKIMKYI